MITSTHLSDSRAAYPRQQAGAVRGLRAGTCPGRLLIFGIFLLQKQDTAGPLNWFLGCSHSAHWYFRRLLMRRWQWRSVGRDWGSAVHFTGAAARRSPRSNTLPPLRRGKLIPKRPPYAHCKDARSDRRATSFVFILQESLSDKRSKRQKRRNNNTIKTKPRAQNTERRRRRRRFPH